MARPGTLLERPRLRQMRREALIRFSRIVQVLKTRTSASPCVAASRPELLEEALDALRVVSVIWQPNVVTW